MATATTASQNQAVLRARFPRASRDIRQAAGLPSRFVDSCGRVGWFTVQAVGQIGHALRFYRKEVVRLIAEIGMGAGAMAVVGGTVAVVGFAPRLNPCSSPVFPAGGVT